MIRTHEDIVNRFTANSPEIITVDNRDVTGKEITATQEITQENSKSTPEVSFSSDESIKAQRAAVLLLTGVLPAHIRAAIYALIDTTKLEK